MTDQQVNPNFLTDKNAAIVKQTGRMFQDTLKLRIAVDNRLGDLTRRGVLTKEDQDAIFKPVEKRFRAAEAEALGLMWPFVKDMPVVSDWMIQVRGIAKRLIARLISNIVNIGRFDTISKLWAYSGMHVETRMYFRDKDGKVMDPQRGNKGKKPIRLQAHDQNGDVLRYKTLDFEWVKTDEPKKHSKGEGDTKKELKRIVSDWQTISAKKVQIRVVAPRRYRGETANWNQELKSSARLVAECLVKANDTYYERVYLPYKQREIEKVVAAGKGVWATVVTKDEKTGKTKSQMRPAYGPESLIEDFDAGRLKKPKNPEWTMARVNARALRYLAKRFLAHLYLVWRKLADLPVRAPYVSEKLGHTTLDDPWDFLEDKTSDKHKRTKEIA